MSNKQLAALVLCNKKIIDIMNILNTNGIPDNNIKHVKYISEFERELEKTKYDVIIKYSISYNLNNDNTSLVLSLYYKDDIEKVITKYITNLRVLFK